MQNRCPIPFLASRCRIATGIRRGRTSPKTAPFDTLPRYGTDSEFVFDCSDRVSATETVESIRAATVSAGAWDLSVTR